MSRELLQQQRIPEIIPHRMNVPGIIMFYGETCPHCHRIVPAVDRLEKEDGVVIERLEVWNNPENERRMEALRHFYDTECGGNMIVPSFYDPSSDRLICNPRSYEKLKAWVEATAPQNEFLDGKVLDTFPSP